MARKIRNRDGFGATRAGAVPLSLVWHVFACVRGFDRNRLLAYGGRSLYEIARAIHLTDIRRALTSRWINQFAIRPGDR